jgi:zinc protease
VVTEKTDSAVVEFFRELSRVREEPIPAEELERAKQYVALRLPQQLETTGQIAARVAELATYDLPLDYYDDYVERILAVTSADVQRVAREYVRPGGSMVVVVGDRQVIEQGLRALPVGPVEIRRIDEFVR